MDFYDNRVPERWRADVGKLATLYEACGLSGQDVYGISSLKFHNWVAHQVKSADPQFDVPMYMGRGKQAREIAMALSDWAVRQLCMPYSRRVNEG